MSNFIDRITNFFRPLSGAQKTLFGLLSVGVLLLVGLLFYWALQPSYTVLFRQLSPESAQTIVEELQSTDVAYQLDDNGRTIRVPREKVYDLRLKFAANGAAADEYQGYELFDQNALGMTDFMQKVNKKRALEGELSRTINNLKQVESSRIHIVLPERSPFQESTVESSASVVLKLKPNQTLGKQQIEGIAALISGSVENMSPKEVVILDEKGNQISNNAMESTLASAGNEHMRIREATESYLSHKGQSMLDRVVGPGNSILRISTAHNFNKITRQSNTIDPESRTIISEETRSLQNTDQTQEAGQILNPEGEPVTTSNKQNESTVEVKNYEISKTNEVLENSVGEVTRISGSVLLNYKEIVTENEDGEKTTEFEPHTEQEIAEIKKVMASALGLQEGRGDEIIVTQIKFKDPYTLQPQGGGFFGDNFSIFEMIRWFFIIAVAGVIGFLMYRTSKSMGEGGFNVNRMLSNAGGDGNLLEGQSEDEEDIYAQKLSEEARKQLEDNSKASSDIDEFVDEHTSQAAVLVRNLMKQE